MSVKQYAEVVLNVPIDKKFHYRVPASMSGEIEIGKLVKVPFGKRQMIGYCVGFVDTPQVRETKDIIQVLNHGLLLDGRMLSIARWIADHYFCGWGEALDAVLPSSVRKGLRSRTIQMVKLAKDREYINAQLTNLKRRAPKQARALEILLDTEGGMTRRELGDLSGCGPSGFSRLAQLGLINLTKIPTVEALTQEHIIKSPHLTPTDEQKVALDLARSKVVEKRFSVLLLQGITGSGKTEVYLQTIQEAIIRGRKAIVLVPEIALTPQTIWRFKSRFDNIAVLHSHLSGGQHHLQWQAIKEGRADVVIGARSAVFAPLSNLGVIIIDEEHENTYKQDNVPRYHARDVAIVRARHDNALVILGTATPSLESFYNAQIGNYDRVVLHKRVEGRPLPPVDIVDMRQELRERKWQHHLSRLLEKCMEQTLARREQVILFLNRRGFTPFITCKKCGFVLKCKRCEIALNYHKKISQALCHYCNYDAPVPEQCPECGNTALKHFGFGTEKIEDEVTKRFPGNNVLRMDSDTMRGHAAYEKALSAFRRGDIDILLGTQMIAKGFDFPNVTLVGIVSADTMLNIPDFRASERTFQLLAQASGRTGRGPKGGRVIIQSFNPAQYSIVCATTHDYEKLARKELEYRRQLNYPPYSKLLMILFRGSKLEAVKERSFIVADRLKNFAKSCIETQGLASLQVLGPAPASITKIKNKFRWHILVKAQSYEMFQKMLEDAKGELKTSKGVQAIIDVDPGMML
ncbi:MAG: replication restart helicase PriA [Candidatus Brocadiales bacterium]